MSEKRKCAKNTVFALGVLASACVAFLCYLKGKKDGYAEAMAEQNEEEFKAFCNGGNECCVCLDKEVCDELENEGEAIEPDGSVEKTDKTNE